MRFAVTSPFVPFLRPLAVVPLAVAVVLSGGIAVACGMDRNAESEADEALTEAPPTWMTEDEYRFGDSAEEELFFTSPVVRADPARGRIFAVDRPNHQVSVLALDGTLLFRVGRKGEGPGEFINMRSLRIEPDGAFAVQEFGRGRYARFTAHGELVGTTPGPQSNALSYQGLPVSLTSWKLDGAGWHPSPACPSCASEIWATDAGVLQNLCCGWTSATGYTSRCFRGMGRATPYG